MSKITDEELREVWDNLCAAGLTVTCRDIRDHIAALTEERDALRERVQALEALGMEVCGALGLRWQPHDAALTARLDEVRAAESRLEAIQQRVRETTEDMLLSAGDIASVAPEDPIGLIQSTAREFASRVLSEDAAEAPPREVLCEHGGGEGRECDVCFPPSTHRANSPKLSDSSPEPSTAEDFKTALNGLMATSVVADAEAALSRLERRMGAMVKALSRAKAALTRGGGPEFGRKGRDRGLLEEVDAVLTDAPDVFTLEEVETLIQWHVAQNEQDAARASLKALRK